MSFSVPFIEGIDLHVEGRISTEEAARQEKTAREILQRLATQPGLILADEVGMGKTFVALAVAACVALNDDEQRPVVVMVPPSLKEKWPRDFQLFREKCMPVRAAANFRHKSADRAVEFLKILDDPAGKKRSLIFLTHGAMYRGLQDGWVKLALIYRALYKRKNTTDLRRALCRSMGRLLQMSWIDRQNPDIWEKLLDHDPEDWLKILQRHEIDPEGDDSIHSDDDPVPELIRNALWDLNTDAVYDALYKIPFRQSENFDARLMDARRGINEGLKELWSECVHSVRFTLPLLILDEAHHLKNARTQLASLFQQQDAMEDAKQISRGPLAQVFERMLFLTATPFQLGHEELCSVLDRFEGIAWQVPEKAPQMDSAEFSKNIKELRTKLDEAQESALRLDHTWSRLRESDLSVNGVTQPDVESWWPLALENPQSCTEPAKDVLEAFSRIA